MLYWTMRYISFHCWNRCCLPVMSKIKPLFFCEQFNDVNFYFLTLSGDVGGRIILAWSGCNNWLKRLCCCDGVGLLLEDCFSWLELVIIIGWFDCCAIGEGEAWTESIPESPCSTLSELRRFDDDEADGDCSIKVVSMCRVCKKQVEILSCNHHYSLFLHCRHSIPKKWSFVHQVRFVDCLD